MTDEELRKVAGTREYLDWDIEYEGIEVIAFVDGFRYCEKTIKERIKEAWYAGCRKGSEGHGFPSYGAAIDRAYEDWFNNHSHDEPMSTCENCKNIIDTDEN